MTGSAKAHLNAKVVLTSEAAYTDSSAGSKSKHFTDEGNSSHKDAAKDKSDKDIALVGKFEEMVVGEEKQELRGGDTME